MTQFNNQPIPIIDSRRCNGCGRCVRPCPAKVLEVQEGRAVVAQSFACDYIGMCEAVCLVNAITRPFEIVMWEGKFPE